MFMIIAQLLRKVTFLFEFYEIYVLNYSRHRSFRIIRTFKIGTCAEKLSGIYNGILVFTYESMQATHRGIPSVPHYGVLTVACGRLPGKGLPSTGILLRRSKPAGIYLFTLTFPPSLLVSLIPEVLRLLTRGMPVSLWVHIRPHQVTGVLLTRSRQCRIRMSRTHRRKRVGLRSPGLPERGVYLTEEVHRWCGLPTRSGPAETGRIFPRCGICLKHLPDACCT